jgi:hypothetical protein
MFPRVSLEASPRFQTMSLLKRIVLLLLGERALLLEAKILKWTKLRCSFGKNLRLAHLQNGAHPMPSHLNQLTQLSLILLPYPLQNLGLPRENRAALVCGDNAFPGLYLSG